MNKILPLLAKHNISMTITPTNETDLEVMWLVGDKKKATMVTPSLMQSIELDVSKHLLNITRIIIRKEGLDKPTRLDLMRECAEGVE